MAFDETFYMGYESGSHRFANSRWERRGYFGNYEYSIAGSIVGVMGGSIFGRVVLATVRYAASANILIAGVIYFTLAKVLAKYVLYGQQQRELVFPTDVTTHVHLAFYCFYFFYYSRK